MIHAAPAPPESASPSLYRQMVDLANEGIWALDLRAGTTYVNPRMARMLGWTAEEMLGRPVFEFMDAAAVPEAREHLELLSQGIQEEYDFRFRRRDGTDLWTFCCTSPLYDASGELAGALAMVTDVTERRHAEAQLQEFARQLERSNRELREFAYVASHDLQEPLRKIEAFGDRLKQKLGEQLSTEGGDYLERMQAAARRMRTLIDDLLTFSRVSCAARPFRPVHLAEVAREVISDLEARIEHSGGSVRLGELPTVEAEPTQMRQLLQNLIGNALKFARPGCPPRVTVRSQPVCPDPADFPDGLPAGPLWEITVADNGIGFDARYADRIFHPFQRLHGRGEYEGTGIGLAICRKIAERHGGRITAQSQPGEGSTFRITLPATRADADPAEPLPCAEPRSESRAAPLNEASGSPLQRGSAPCSHGVQPVGGAAERD